MNSVKEKAYAKINLYLDVRSKREDCFHTVETVMHTLSLCDEVTITLLSRSKRGVKLLLDGNKHLPVDGKNIAYAAAMLFLDRLSLDCEVGLKLVKRIPVCAGLAGGSADAAAVLRGMNRLFGKPMTQKMLLSLAAELGSDVPFCLLGGTALCSGRGEQVMRLGDGLRLSAVIAIDNEHVSTPMAYAALDEMYSDFDGSVKTPVYDLSALLSAINEGRLPEGELYNIFERAVLPTCPGADRIKRRLYELGAEHAMMSGSGPGVFGLFTDLGAATSAAEALLREGVTAYVAESI